MKVVALEKDFLCQENFLAFFERIEKVRVEKVQRGKVKLRFTEKKVPISYNGLLELGISKDWLDKRRYKRQKIYHCSVNLKEVLVLTTYSNELNGAIPDAVGWVVIKDLVTGSVIISFEIRRSSEKFFDNLFDQAIASLEFAQKWPKCQFCTVSLVPVQINEHFMHDREFICLQPGCIGLYQPTDIFITSIILTHKNSVVFFVGYKRYEKYTEQNRLNKKEPIPRRWLRYCTKHGIPIKRIRTDLPEGIDPPHDDSGLYPNG